MKKRECSGGFIQEGNRFLFGKRSVAKDWAPGVWDIVGGKARKKEDPLDTLVRETFEEVGVSVLKAVLIRTLEIAGEDGKYLFTYHIYMITEYSGKPVNCSKEHSALGWFTREELSGVSLALPEYLSMIDDWLEQDKGLPSLRH